MKANGPERPSFHLLSLNLISKYNDMLLRVTGDIDWSCLHLTGLCAGRMNNFMFKGSWDSCCRQHCIMVVFFFWGGGHFEQCSMFLVNHFQ